MASPNLAKSHYQVEETPSEASNKAQAQAYQAVQKAKEETQTKANNKAVSE